MAKKVTEPKFEPHYVRMLDAVLEYMDSIGEREDTKINQRDITIIQALIEFYDFEVLDKQDIIDVMDDVKVRADQLEREKESEPN